MFDRVVGMVLGSSTEENLADEEPVGGATQHPSDIDATGSSVATVEGDLDGGGTETMGAQQDGPADPNDGAVAPPTSSVPRAAAAIGNSSTTSVSVPEDVVSVPDTVAGSPEQMAATPAVNAVADTADKATVKNDTESVADIEPAAPTSVTGDTTVTVGSDVHGSASPSMQSASTAVAKPVISPEELAAATVSRRCCG